MKIAFFIFTVSVALFIGCNDGHPSANESQNDPKALAETIFYLIQNEKYDALPALIDEGANEDSRQLATLKDADATTQKQTREYFKTASLNGEPLIDGDKATVNLRLGHEGTFEETFGMVKKAGKWYLQSY